MPDFYSTREMADLLGTLTWRVRRLYEDGTLPEPPRFAGKRAIPRQSIPAIVDALRNRGWLPVELAQEATSSIAHIDPAVDEKSQALLNKRRTAEVLDVSEATLDGACQSKHSKQEVAAR